MLGLFEKQWPEPSEQTYPFSQIISTKSVWQCLAHSKLWSQSQETLPPASFHCTRRSASVDSLERNQGALLVLRVVCGPS